MMQISWMNPVYAGQILTGLAGVGGIFADGQITRLRLLLAAIATLSLLTSLLVAARAESEGERVRKHLETLLRSMEVPYFIIAAVSEVVKTAAGKLGWAWTKQENFKNATHYDFRGEAGQKGLLVVSEQEFRDLWILEEDKRLHAIKKRLFGATDEDLKGPASQEQDDELLGEVIREVVSTEVDGPHWIAVHPQADGTYTYTVRREQEDAGRVFLRLSPERRQELGKIVPIRRYAVVADEVRNALLQPPC